MTWDRRRVLGAGAVLATLGADGWTRSAVAQGLSGRPITFLVPYTPGTGMDSLARIIGDELGKRWNQPVLVENRAGASGNIGAGVAARAAPDGHTIMFTANTLVMNESLFRSVPYDTRKSFAAVAELATGTLALAVSPGLGVSTVAEFLALVRAKPGELNYASPGRGTPQHLSMELFKLNERLKITHVPYSGSAGAITDLMGGHVAAMFLPVHTALPLVESGRIRILAVGSEARAPQAPQVPTLAESGVPNLDIDLWYGAFAPAGTPAAIVERFNGAFNDILQLPAVRAALGNQGLVPAGGPSDRLAGLVEKDRPRWAKVVKDAGITAD